MIDIESSLNLENGSRDVIQREDIDVMNRGRRLERSVFNVRKLSFEMCYGILEINDRFVILFRYLRPNTTVYLNDKFCYHQSDLKKAFTDIYCTIRKHYYSYS